METGDGHQHPAANEVQVAERAGEAAVDVGDPGSLPLASPRGSSEEAKRNKSPNQMEKPTFRHQDAAMQLVPCRWEPLNLDSSLPEAETGTSRPSSSDKTEEERPVEGNGEDEDMDATPAQVSDSEDEDEDEDEEVEGEGEEEEGPGTYFTGTDSNLDEMMDIGTVDQQEQEAQMKKDDEDVKDKHGSSSEGHAVLVGEDAVPEVDADVEATTAAAEDEESTDEKVPLDASPLSHATAGTAGGDMTNGMKVVQLSVPETSALPPSPPVKIKDEPVDEEYNQALLCTPTTVKDEPSTAKDDLQIGLVYSVTPPANAPQQRADSSSASLHMTCAHCKMALAKGQTAYQRKGSPMLFCSTGCLTASLSSSKSVKTCHHCQKRISRPQDIILAPDTDGIMKGFCCQTCLTAFSRRRSTRSAKAKLSPPVGLQGQMACSMCAKFSISKHEVVLSGTVHRMCSDSCFKRFRTTNHLTMAGCANCGSFCHVRPLLLRMEGSSKTLCNMDCLTKYKNKTKMSLPCSMCRSPRPIADMVHNKGTDDSVSLFCSSSCVMAFMVQSVSSSGAHMNCDNCGKHTVPAYHLAMSDTTIRNFCTLSCVMSFQEKFKVKQKQASVFPKLSVASSQDQSATLHPLKLTTSATLNCAHCARKMSSKPEVIQIKNKLVFVCDVSCAEQFKTAKNVTSRCGYCKMDKICKEVKRVNSKNHFFCSNGCKLLYEHELEKSWGKHCTSCGYCRRVSKKLVTELYGGSTEEFCSEDCRSKYTMLFCHVAKCTSCGQKGKLKQSLVMLGDVMNFCDLPCLFQFCNLQVKTQGDIFPPDSQEATPVIANVVSLACEPASPGTPERPSQQSADSLTQDSELASVNADWEKPQHSSASRTQKNKALLCKPLVQNKGISCKVQTASVEAQTDLSLPKIVVLPVPVPVYVPVPMSMYSQCTPKAVGVPLPLPVPVLLPVTTSNADRIVETIKKIKEKFPEDPFEAELILMAEMVAEQTGNAGGGETEADKKAEKESEGGPAGDAMSAYSDDLDTDDLASLLNNWDEPSSDAGPAAGQAGPAVRKPISNAPPPPPPPMDIEADFPVETLEKMAHLRELSPQPASPSPAALRRRQASRKSRDKKGRKRLSKAAATPTKKDSAYKAAVGNVPKLKSEYGMDAWKRWVRWRDGQPNVEMPRIGSRPLVLKDDILRCTTAELSYGLCCFVAEVKRPNGERYSPDGLFYLCLGIQQHLFENGRVENIFMDPFYCKFSTEFTGTLRGFRPSLTASGYIHSRVEEEYLWDCKQLGVYSPIVLLNTLLFFFCKNFGFTTVEQHRQLSFAHVMRCTKTDHSSGKTTFLRFYPPIPPADVQPDSDFLPPAKKRKEEEAKEERILEMMENTDNPLRCPVRLYEFYLSKCSETVKQRTDMFYLLPERCCVPNSPLWFSSTPLGEDTKEAMLTRILTVRDLHVAARQRTLEPKDDNDAGNDKDEFGGDEDEDNVGDYWE
ncbi:zinc finger MYM-type protein 4 [Dunckerocampus dactyliophorus]|uniref:zinc finger MYM-type protein 4 n=1 Tax=Dunckerocampus dactyliophorus TaxID=161453 RepID=UPI0024066E1E|nr:zinc finger MYM-type protein 4 [Dunckerocampus dactyliophorus]